MSTDPVKPSPFQELSPPMFHVSQKSRMPAEVSS